VFIKVLKLLLVLSTSFAMLFMKEVMASNYYQVQIVPGVDLYHKNIESVSKDYQGFIWFIAGNLLYRYDGISVKPFTELYLGPLHFTEVNNLLTDCQGRLWLETRNGLLIFDIKNWKFIQDKDWVKELLGEQILAMFDQNKKQYVATKNGVLWEINKTGKKKLLRFPPTSNELRRPVGRRLIADGRQLWFAYNKLLYQIDLLTGKIKKNEIPKDIYQQLDDIFILRDGLLLRNYGLGYVTFDGKKFKKANPKALSLGDMCDWAHWSFTEDNKVIFLFQDGRYFEYDANLQLTPLFAGQHYISKDLLKSKLNQLSFKNGEVLCATERGLYSVLKTNFAIEYWNTGTARAILKQKDIYYIGGYTPLKSFRLNSPLIEEKAPLNNYYAFLPVNQDTTLIGLEGEFLGLLIKGRFKRAPYKKKIEVKEELSTLVFSLCHYKDRQYLVGTYSGIWIYDLKTHDVFPLKDNGGHIVGAGQKINALKMRNKVATFSSENGYYEFEAGAVKKVYPYSAEKLNVFTHNFHQGKIFLATKGKGLIVIDLERKKAVSYTTKNGLASNVIFTMEWVDDNLFLGTFSGLTVWDTKNFYNAYSSNGLPFEEFNQASVYYDVQYGKIFLGGILGCIAIDPKKFLQRLKEQHVPAPIVASIAVANSAGNVLRYYTPSIDADTILLSKQAFSINLDIAKIDAYKYNYNTYYRIYPLFKEFQELKTSGKINLSNLKTGEYEIEIKTVSSNGLSEMSKKWLFYKSPRFYETQLFYVLLTLAVGILIYVITILKSSQRKRDKILRQELSRDLHDEVGGLLTGISMQAELFPMQAKNSLMTVSLDKITAYSREAVQTMDDIIWAIDSRNNKQGNLEDRMKFLAAQIFAEQQIKVNFEIDIPVPRDLPQYIRHNVYLIFKEALHNVCKHNRFAAVNIGLKIYHHVLELEIANTMDRMNEVEVDWKKLRKGQGIGNMERRAEAIGAKLTVGQVLNVYKVHLVIKFSFKERILKFF